MSFVQLTLSRPTLPTEEGQRQQDNHRDNLSPIRLRVLVQSRTSSMARRVQFPIPDPMNQARKIAVLRKQLESVQQNTGIQTELIRTLLVKTKLESSCLKLQKYSKAVVDESRIRAKEEEQRENFRRSERLQRHNELSAKLRFKDLLNNMRREKEFEKQQLLRTMTSRGRGNNV